MLDPQIKRGLLETCVLSVLCYGDSYGYKMIKDLSCCIEVSESTLYPILRRLEAADRLSTYSIEYNGRLRKFYRLEEPGRNQITSFLQSWDELTAIYEFIREGIANDQA